MHKNAKESHLKSVVYKLQATQNPYPNDIDIYIV